MAIVLKTLVVAYAFTLFLLAQASHLRSFPHVHRRQNLPAGWVSEGCYTDSVADRTLSSDSYTSTTAMTDESCLDFCNTAGYIYAGTEYAQECYCGNVIGGQGTTAAAGDCDMACTGNAAEICGAGNRLSLYWSGQTPPAGPIIAPSVGDWISLGCYSDSVAARTLPNGVNTAGDVTVQTCTEACFNAGYSISGAEYADQCFCGNSFQNSGAPIPSSDCNMACAGNSSEFCGGPNALNVYNFTGTGLPAPGNPGNGNGDNSSVSPVTSGLPPPWAYASCWVDGQNGRILVDNLPDNSAVTVESCIASCSSANYSLAGLEYSVQCFCGDQLIEGATKAADSDCDMGCGGAATEACGGPDRISLYSTSPNVTVIPVPNIQTTGLGQWQYQGCLNEVNGGRVFPYLNTWVNNNTVEACLDSCAAYGYPAAGMEYGNECWCGDVSDVTSTNTGFAPASSCNFPCSGDPAHLCGGPLVLQLYYYSGGLFTWHTPANTGYYKFLVPGVVVPLIATVGVNNKVTFLEKSGTSTYPNSTGAYELDLTLVDQFDLAWRAMHVKTDVFCSASLILPDKGARQINIGGWSLDSTFGVRIYTPDGSAGVNGTNDWEENVNELTLQRGRWYPSSVILANGSILVVGGETGSNGPPQPNLEILPTTPGGSTVVYLDFLNRTDPNNLYPFLVVLPSGKIFIGYYNEARILDPVTFNTVTTLPNIPAAVNNFLGGRTYPMEGTAVVLPQYAPYTDDLEMLICGGSTPGAAVALDNCVSITPEAANPTWTLERMPSKRVMPCMAGLPDGTFLILNGAEQGVAGFGLASEPNLGALLYDPSQPVNSRFSILADTIVARLYHSEATLLNDGRVLVSGSDPETYYPNGTAIYPEEFRIEVYYPPYLTQGYTQPTYTITNTDWNYGADYTITVQLSQGTPSTMRVSLVAATSSTHGNMMGGRTIFPAFSCNGNTCTITAPPNANICPPGWHQLFILDGPTPSISQWVRIGGDPAQLGNWPDYPDFTLPGV